MSTCKCVSIGCVFNKQISRGICIGVSQDTKIYKKDVVRLCYVTEKPTMQGNCHVMLQAQVTPGEADLIGLSSIKASIIGEGLIRKMLAEEQAFSHIQKQEETASEKAKETASDNKKSA